MYCPNCQAEYREGFSECADCSVPLLEGAPPLAAADTTPDLELVPVFECADPVTVTLAASLLDEAGIPYYSRLEALEFGGGLAYATPLRHPQTFFSVPRDRATEAAQLLASIAEMIGDGEDVEDGAGK